jgi:transposase
MGEVSMIGLDLAKNFIQAHGADATGKVLFRKKLRRSQLLPFLAEQPACVVAMEACAGAHHVGREAHKFGHEAKLMPAHYVKPFAKRGKSDRIDAEAVVDAASRPNMRFVAVKSAEQQAAVIVFRTRDLLVRQRTQSINALRGHLAEFGLVAPKGRGHLPELAALIDDAATPQAARPMCLMLMEAIESLDARIKMLDREIRRRAKADAESRRLMTVPGLGPILSTAVPALAPPPESFRKGRDFAAWVGLTPLQRSTGGYERIGKTSKMGERTLRRLFMLGAAALVRQAVRTGAAQSPWLARMLARKPRMLVITALANKLARIAWSVMRNAEDYRAPAATV